MKFWQKVAVHQECSKHDRATILPVLRSRAMVRATVMVMTMTTVALLQDLWFGKSGGVRLRVRWAVEL